MRFSSLLSIEIRTPKKDIFIDLKNENGWEKMIEMLLDYVDKKYEEDEEE